MRDFLNSLLLSTRNKVSRRRHRRHSALAAGRSGQSSELLETRTLLAAHLILSDAPAITVAPGESVNIPIVYQTLNDNNVPEALKSDRFNFNLHYDADVLDWVSTTSVFTEGLLNTPNQPLAETHGMVVGDDQDPATDTVLLANYASETGWPDNPNVKGQVLYVARFTAKAEFTGSTIKFSANQTGSVVGQSSDFSFEHFPVVLQAPAGLRLSIEDAPAVTEGGNSVFKVKLSAAPSTTVTVNYSTLDGNGPTGATSPNDYTSKTDQTLKFLTGETEKLVTIATVNDDVVESDESFRVALSDASGATLGTAQATGTIKDNDTALPSLSIANASAVTEGGKSLFNVTLSRAADTAVTVKYSTTDGNGPTGAINGVDVTAQTDQVLTFAAGETTNTITVNTIDDELPETAEEFEVTLSDAVGANISRRTATGTINDNDRDGPAFSIGDAPGITEGQDAIFTVTLSEASSESLTVNYSTNDGTGPDGAGAASDFTGVTNQTLTFDAGQTEKIITISTTDDNDEEATETFKVTLSNAVDAAISKSSATGTIFDNDTIPPLPGDVDGDADFDANDSFLIQLVRLSGTNAQIDQSKGSSTLTAAQIRTNVAQLTSPGDVDGDDDFDANDSFLVQLVKLSGTDAQIDQLKGTSSLTASQIRANVNALGGGSTASSVVSQSPAAVQSVMDAQTKNDDAPGLFAHEEQGTVSVAPPPAAGTETNDVSTAAWEDFREWVDAI